MGADRQPTNGSAAQRHGSQSHRFAVRVWSNLCICSPGLVELVKSNLAPDFPLFHAANSLVAEHIFTSDTLWIQKYKILFPHKRHVPFLHENMYCNSILPAPKLEIFLEN